MHPLHDYLVKQLAEKLRSKKVIVWYDARREFVPFLTELGDVTSGPGAPVPVQVAGIRTSLVKYEGSFFELRSLVEPLVRADTPDPVLVYIPGVDRDRHGSVLMELEKAGECYEPQLKRLARNVLRQQYTDGVIDELLAPERVDYEDLAGAVSNTTVSEPPSILKTIFSDVSGNDNLFAAWLTSNTHDTDIEIKEAVPELAKLVRSRLGLELRADSPLAKLRALTVRYVLIGEFRSELRCGAPSGIDSVPVPKTKEHETAVRNLARKMRSDFPDAYCALADAVEAELNLRVAPLSAEDLGSIDIFRFEERIVLTYCGQLIATEQFDKALRVIQEREHGFWLDRDVERRAQWEACRRMAELGSVTVDTRAALAKVDEDPNAWVSAYTGEHGWYRVDQAQRRLETWVANLDDEPQERPLEVVRRAYDDACRKMASGFTRSLVKSNWAISGSSHQTQVFSFIREAPKPVAYFLVDAMRFEMGIELAERLPNAAEVSVRYAIAALPTLTPIGMGALQPDASASFSVVENGGKLGALIEDSFLPDLPARKKFMAARVPSLVDMTLDDLLSLHGSRLAKRLEGVQVIVVRSQEIDQAGEAGFTLQARQVMDTVIDNLARSIRKLSAAGIEHAIVTADHGHLFFASERDQSMRTDSPGGHQVELHRRCWIGRGGATPPGCVRVSASALGYVSDLEFVFPAGAGIFRAGGDLAFHHGGPSLEELIVPVLTMRMKIRDEVGSSEEPVTVSGLPDAVTNRIFSATVHFAEGRLPLFSTAMAVRPLLVSGGKQVGTVGMAVDAELDRATGCVLLQAGKPTTVAFQLTDETAASLRVVVQDPATDAELYRSPADIPVRLGV
jgi:hypothetical protein